MARVGFPVAVGLAGVLLLQLATGWLLRSVRPAIDEFPPSPGRSGLDALALGDSQFLFRLEIMWLQDFGDGGGRVKPLRDFDYRRVGEWLEAVDRLDPQSQAIFELGSRFFGALTDPATARAKVGVIAGFFERAGMADPLRRWEWLAWSAITNQRLVKDPELAKRTGEDLLRLRGNDDVPSWLPLLAIPMFRVAGDEAEAAQLAADPDMRERQQRQIEELNRNLRQ